MNIMQGCKIQDTRSKQIQNHKTQIKKVLDLKFVSFNLFASCILYLIPVFLFFTFTHSVSAASLSGHILLQVEQHGEAWYVSPATGLRYYLGRPDDAFRIMREQGIGITDANLEKIPVGMLGTTAASQSGKIDLNFSAQQKGKIFLQVEQKGEAWYVNPDDARRYYLGRPADAFAVMRAFGLGISDTNLLKIPEALDNSLAVVAMEARLHELINQERIKNGLQPLLWNAQVAQVARRHSADLAAENKAFTGINKACDLPLIHHEGFVFGYDHGDRLNSSNIYYFEKSGENIALMSAITYKIQYQTGDQGSQELARCSSDRSFWENRYDTALEIAPAGTAKLDIIRNEITARTEYFSGLSPVKTTAIENFDQASLAAKTVQGWMDSPGHRQNILTTDFDEVGMGVAFSDSYLFATQVFIKRSACGYQGGPCCEHKGCYLPASCQADNVCRE